MAELILWALKTTTDCGPPSRSGTKTMGAENRENTRMRPVFSLIMR